MKKQVLLLIMILISTGNYIAAQTTTPESRHEFRAGYGVLSGTEVGIAFGYGLGSAIGSAIFGGSQSADPVLCGTFSANYNYFLNKRLSFGVQGGLTPIYFPDGAYNSQRNTNYNWLHVLQGYARLDVHYVTRPRFQMYSGIMAGGILLTEDDNAYWAGHVNLLGFRFGRKQAFYTELGLGFSSTLAAGYAVRF